MLLQIHHSKVYRYLSLANSTVILYDTNEILTILKCSIDEFKIICILSGSDYYNFDIGNLAKCFHLFNRFKAILKVDSPFFFFWNLSLFNDL